MSEKIVILLQLSLFANTVVFFCSLLGLISHFSWEGDSGDKISTQWPCASKRSITYTNLILF